MSEVIKQLEERLTQLRQGREQLLANLQVTSGAISEVERTLELLKTPAPIVVDDVARMDEQMPPRRKRRAEETTTG